MKIEMNDSAAIALTVTLCGLALLICLTIGCHIDNDRRKTISVEALRNGYHEGDLGRWVK